MVFSTNRFDTIFKDKNVRVRPEYSRPTVLVWPFFNNTKARQGTRLLSDTAGIAHVYQGTQLNPMESFSPRIVCVPT